MTADDLRLLLDYHYWARDRLLDATDALTQEQLTRDLGNSFRSVRDTLAHLHGSEWIWLSRWQGTSPTAGLPAGSVRGRRGRPRGLVGDSKCRCARSPRR